MKGREPGAVSPAKVMNGNSSCTGEMMDAIRTNYEESPQAGAAKCDRQGQADSPRAWPTLSAERRDARARRLADSAWAGPRNSRPSSSTKHGCGVPRVPLLRNWPKSYHV